MFQLDPRLANDTVPVASLDLCRVLLMNDARYPWLILVPARDGLSELHDLTADDQLLLNDEIMRASRAMTKLFTPEKINVGALGNIVRQLHIHVVARRTDDPAWPGPVWGHSPATPYAPEQIADMVSRLAAVLAPRNAGV
ncbi:MAG: HIT family protein [Rhodospirillales bacterium]|nr:HIT family protein [Rhodospirillales bacterium]